MDPQIDVDGEELARICEEHGIEKLALFGSVLRDDFDPDSDVDILVTFDPDARVGLIELAGIQRELSELVGRKIDLVPANSLKPALRDDVISSAETLHAA